MVGQKKGISCGFIFLFTLLRVYLETTYLAEIEIFLLKVIYKKIIKITKS